SALVLVIFLAAFVAAFQRYHQPSRLRMPALVMLGLGVLMAPINPGANVFFSYPSWFLGRAFPPRQAAAVIAAIAASVIGLSVGFELDLSFFLPALLLTVGLGGLSIATRRTEDAQLALKQSRAEAEHLARIAERERIARDLHDTIGHKLSIIALKSDLAAQISADTAPEATEEMRAINDVARECLSEIRATLSGYWELSLDAELTSLTASLHDADVDVTTDIDATDLQAPIETALAMCFREAVTNVIRHADASSCALQLNSLGTEVQAVIADDGRGLNGDPGRGLTGMRQRVEHMGGSLLIENDNGVRVTIRLPLDKGARRGH
ncbi:MAG: sensor histidine kinase, partial [Pseudomonadota bacterium]